MEKIELNLFLNMNVYSRAIHIHMHGIVMGISHLICRSVSPCDTLFLFWRASFVGHAQVPSFFSFHLFIFRSYSSIAQSFRINTYIVLYTYIQPRLPRLVLMLVIISDMFQTIGFLTFRIYHRQYV